jgi:hypothetical protein
VSRWAPPRTDSASGRTGSGLGWAGPAAGIPFLHSGWRRAGYAPRRLPSPSRRMRCSLRSRPRRRLPRRPPSRRLPATERSRWRPAASRAWAGYQSMGASQGLGWHGAACPFRRPAWSPPPWQEYPACPRGKLRAPQPAGPAALGRGSPTCHAGRGNQPSILRRADMTVAMTSIFETVAGGGGLTWASIAARKRSADSRRAIRLVMCR